jgi:signal transduction histidine kinase
MAYWDISKFSTRPGLALVLRYGLAVASVAIALAITVVTHLHNSPPRFVSHFVLIAIAITFWFAGTGPSLLALLLSCLGVSFLAENHFLTPDFPLASFLSFFVIFTLLMSLFSVSRHRAQKLLREARDSMIGLEARVNERTRIARELHDTLLQSFQGLLLRLQAASNLLPTRPDEAKKKLDNAIDQASQAIAEGRSAVQGLRSSRGVTNDFAIAIRTLGEELAAGETSQKSPILDVAVEGAPKDLKPIIRDEVYRIAGEAMRNAFRHARARRIEVEIRYDEQHLRFRVRDDGKGIGPSVLDHGRAPGHWGLRGMRERAKLVGGKLEIWSKLDSGTEVELSIPAASAYERPPASRWSIFSRIGRS